MSLEKQGIQIDDTFAEAFPMQGTRLIITADSEKWARIAAATMTGFATSVIACGVEAGIERMVPASETPDGRPGASVLMFAMDKNTLQNQVRDRVGQCVLTSPGSACFSGWESDDTLALGKLMKYFGDGWQISKQIGGKRYWRVPVMDGEFICEETTGVKPDSIGGGNFFIMGKTKEGVLRASERAVQAIEATNDVIAPFPGGIVRSGSKVGSKYAGQFASTNDAFCPTLRGKANSALSPEIEAVLEIVIDGLSFEAIAQSTRAGIAAVCEGGTADGVLRISAGNYGGNLGPHHFHLKDLV